MAFASVPFSTDMDPVTVVLILTLSVSLAVLLFRNRRLGKFPPGPIGLPIVGYLPYLMPKPHVELLKLKEKYGSIYSIRLGSKLAVVLADYESVRDAFSKDALMGVSGDAGFEMNPETLASKAVTDLPWKEQRKFTLHLLRELGMGKSSMEVHIKDEILDLLERLDKEVYKPIVLTPFMAPSTSNNISSIAFGKRRKFQDPKRIMLDAMFKKMGDLMGIVAWMTFFPFLKQVFKAIGIGSQKELSDAVNSVKNYLRDEIKEHQNNKSPDDNNVRDFIDGYLREIEMTKSDPTSTFTIPVLEDILLMLFAAGGESVRVCIEWLLLACAGHEDVQQKIQFEIDETIGREKFPSRSDVKMMPYTMAAIMETLRWRATLVTSFPRITLSDVRINSYVIPKGTNVIALLWSIHHDTQLWGKDTDSFKPERFLNESGKKLKKPDYFIPFSTGKRSCPGEEVAYLEAFLYVTAILQKFSIRLPEGAVADYEGVLGLSLVPKEQRLILEPR